MFGKSGSSISGGGGSVSLDSNGAVILAPLSGGSAPTIPVGPKVGIYDDGGGARTGILFGRDIVYLYNHNASGYASVTLGALTAAGTGTHTFSGPVRVGPASANAVDNSFQAHDANGVTEFSGFSLYRSSTRRWAFVLENSTNDLVFKNSGPTEAIRVTQTNAYVQVATRLGLGVAPSYTFHAAGDCYMTGLVSVGSTVPNNNYWFLSSGSSTTRSMGAFIQQAASATVPVVVAKLGATPAAGGYGIVVRDSADNDLVRIGGSNTTPSKAAIFFVSALTYYLGTDSSNNFSMGVIGGAENMRFSNGRCTIGSSSWLQFINTSSFQTTVGAAGGASALPATPLKYLLLRDASDNAVAVPCYNPS